MKKAIERLSKRHDKVAAEHVAPNKDGVGETANVTEPKSNPPSAAPRTDAIARQIQKMKHDEDVKRFVICPAVGAKAAFSTRQWNKDLSWLSHTLRIPDDDLDVTLWQKGYLSDTDSTTISSASAKLMEHLELDSGQKNAAIILICHSLGGVLAKKLFCDARQKFPKQAGRIKGMIFFGTPHTALSTKVEDSLFAKMAELNDIDPKTLNLAELNQISEQFLEESVKATDVKFVSFYEKGTGSSHSKIVVDQSAATLGQSTPLPLPLDHLGMSDYKGGNKVVKEGIRTGTISILGSEFVSGEDKVEAKIQSELNQPPSKGRPAYEVSCQQTAKVDGHQSYNITNNTTITQAQHQTNNYYYGGIRSIQGKLSQDQQDKIKQKLEKANANAHAGRIQEPAPGTLKWLSTDDKYTAWLRSTDSEILAVLGDAGTGKSVLSAHIFYELDRRYQPRENNLILHYFIDESTSNQGDAEVLLLQALMSQVLSEHGEALAEMPSSRFNSFISERPDALMGAFGELISKTRVEYLFIIIDALDECDSGAQAKILARLATMSLLQTVIATRVYVSCRSTTPAAHALENFPDERPRVKLLRIMQDKLREDINAVVNAMIDRFIKIGIIAEVHRSRLAELLVSRAEDTFIWLAAAGPVLEEDAGLSYAELETLVDTLPPQLENLYESRLLRFSEKNRKLVGNIFKAIRESFRKLTSQEVNFLISMPEKQKSRPEKQKSVAAIREGCKIKDGGIGLTKLTKHLVTVDKDDHVSFMHSTLKDALKAFSERDMTPDMRLFQANEVDCHRFLAEQCMRFLLLTGFEDYAPKVEEDGDYGLGTLFLTTPARDFGEIPLFEYAANNWWKHLRVDSLILEEELYKMGLSLVSSSDKQPPVWCQYLQAVSQGPQSFPERATPLNLACYCGFPKMLESEEFSPEGLFWAARNNNLDCVQALLRKDNIRLDWLKNEYLQSSLYAAAEGGHLATFRVLLKAGASAAINQCNSTLGSGETPLMIAAAGGHVEMIIEILALEHADPDVEDRNGKTAIFFANTKDILETILKHSRAKVHHVDQAGRNVLSHACSYGEIDIARLLIKENLVDINAADNLGMTPLIRAVRANELAMVHLLLDNNRIDINKRDHKEGRNAISWAASLSRFEILEALCAKDPSGASVEDDGGWFPLEWTIYPTQNLKNATLLLEHSGREFHGRKGLKFFTDTFKYQAGQIAKELISKRVFDINTESSDGRTALSYACEQGSPSLVKLILETPGINTRLMGNMKEHLDEMLTERERTRDSEITSKIRTLVHEKLN